MSNNLRQTGSSVQRHAIFRNARKFPAPINSTPGDLFTYPNPSGQVAGLYYRRGDHWTMLIYVAGCCLHQTDFNGNTFVRAASAWIFRPPPHPLNGRIRSIRLEEEGPRKEQHPATSHRAELRAVIGALQTGCWYENRMKNVVIASSSDYLVIGITERIEEWRRQGWRDTSGTVIANLDLWEALLREIDHYSDFGTKVYFWKVGLYETTEVFTAAIITADNMPDFKPYSGVVRRIKSSE
ncbi:hypothetical protein AC578_5579 [Pseudocercospora eumusae]|uniref:RNase H type-1 domain-containing protein n=1 Tax=Pseudocercospora eumusae TaxID=321146 RepID=A0A139HTC9_9PEZI|nr:hypothetical protein AC578_5579 [Pseudocercospora eumusae]